jgi:hypothetical protein
VGITELKSILKREKRWLKETVWVNNPDSKPESLLKLASSKDMKVLYQLVRRADVTEEVLVRVAENNGRNIGLLVACARHPNAGPATMFRVGEEFKAAIVTRPLDLTWTGEMLRTLAADKSASAERIQYLVDFASSSTGVYLLSESEESEIYAVLAGNESCPPDVLVWLSKLYEWQHHHVDVWPDRRESDSFEILRACVNNPALPSERLVELSGHELEEIRGLVTERMITLVAVV